MSTSPAENAPSPRHDANQGAEEPTEVDHSLATISPEHSALPSTSPQVRSEGLRAKIRLIGSLVIALAAVVVLVTAGPSPVEAGDARVDRTTIWVEDESNQSRTEGAPQQTVVNGWTGNALLDLISEQLDDVAAPAEVDNRPAALLTLGVLLLALATVTTPSTQRQINRA